MKQIYVGFVGDTTCDFETTKKQIEDLKNNYNLNIYVDNEQRLLKWDEIYNIDNLETYMFLNAILVDRKERVDKKQMMDNKPMFAIITIEEGNINRIECYEDYKRNGQLLLVDDLRCGNLINKILKPSYFEKQIL